MTLRQLRLKFRLCSKTTSHFVLSSFEQSWGVVSEQLLRVESVGFVGWNQRRLYDSQMLARVKGKARNVP